ncbi:MAG: hypothetical protein P8L82_02835 [Paracoccaceae bacterium]|nr:hypothetical protein [Paracoccaceae bacterium]
MVDIESKRVFISALALFLQDMMSRMLSAVPIAEDNFWNRKIVEIQLSLAIRANSMKNSTENEEKYI